MVIRTVQLRALDKVSTEAFLDRLESAAKNTLPEGQRLRSRLRALLRNWYDEAVGRRHGTERAAAAYILEQLQKTLHAGIQDR